MGAKERVWEVAGGGREAMQESEPTLFPFSLSLSLSLSLHPTMIDENAARFSAEICAHTADKASYALPRPYHLACSRLGRGRAL